MDTAEAFNALLQQEMVDITAPLVEQQEELKKKEIALTVIAIVLVGAAIYLIK